MKKNNSGFTLFELLVVITIMGVIAATVIPNLLSGREGRRIQGAAENLVADIQFGRMHAMRSGSIAIIIEDRSYRIFTDLDKNYAKNGKDELLKDVFIDDAIVIKNTGDPTSSPFPAIGGAGATAKGVYFNNRGMTENISEKACLTIAAKKNSRKEDERKVCVNQLGRVWISYK